MLIESSLPNSISTALSFATDHGQLNMDSLCDWSNCGETWQKSLKCDECTLDSCNEAISTGVEESKLSSTGIVELSRACSDLLVVNDMCASSTPKRDGYVYKRRKLQRNTVALLSEENATEGTERSAGYHSIVSSVDHPLTVPNEDLDRVPTAFVGSNDILNNGNPSVSRWHRLQKPSNVLSSQINDTRNLESIRDVVPNDRCSVREDEVPVESSLSNLPKFASEHCSGINDSWSSSKFNTGHQSNFMKTEVEEIGECSSSDIVVKDLCISMLKSHGLLGGAWSAGACASLEALGVADANCSLSCKICGCLESPLKMLICDLCEEAFHTSCCNFRVRKQPIDEWYCQPCFKKRPKRVLKKCTGKSFNIAGEMSGHRKNMYDGDLGSLSFMLRDNQPYTSGVRIGKDFQAEVPEWSGPVSGDYSYFDEPVELDPVECQSLNGWNFNMPSKSNSIGNWVQCREVICKDSYENDEGTVCGKWRRAPLHIVQTDDWDCSCAMTWDPIHADCAVPQELETDIVHKHLKSVEMWSARLANKQKTDQTRSDHSNQTRSDGPG